jgi:Domain of unknown function (DUF4345)
MKNLHLIISIIIVIPVAFFYGSKPDYLFEVSLNSKDELNIFKAIMGLYLGFATLWIYGIIKPEFWKAATISNMIFMLGLAFGRIYSITVDGIPTTIFLLGTIGELILGIFAWYQLKKQKAFSS